MDVNNVEADLRTKSGEIKHVLLSAENIYVQNRSIGLLLLMISQSVKGRRRSKTSLQEKKSY